jgi:cell division protein FtsB
VKLPKFSFTGTGLFNIGGAIVIAYLLLVLAQTVKHNYDLGRHINQLQTQISLLQDQKSSLDASTKYYQTNSFRDRQARSQLGLQLPGENVVIIPHSAGTNAQSGAGINGSASGNVLGAQTTVTKSNYQQWLDFLSGSR